MKIVPLLDRVLVKIAKAEEKTPGGIILTAPAKESTLIGEVVALGTDTDKIKVTVGQKVLFDRHDGVPVVNEGEDHRLLTSAELIGVVE